jgi:hypothetical protein
LILSKTLRKSTFYHCFQKHFSQSYNNLNNNQWIVKCKTRIGWTVNQNKTINKKKLSKTKDKDSLLDNKLIIKGKIKTHISSQQGNNRDDNKKTMTIYGIQTAKDNSIIHIHMMLLMEMKMMIMIMKISISVLHSQRHLLLKMINKVAFILMQYSCPWFQSSHSLGTSTWIEAEKKRRHYLTNTIRQCIWGQLRGESIFIVTCGLSKVQLLKQVKSKKTAECTHW